jgi:RHS repeat-associated protein
MLHVNIANGEVCYAAVDFSLPGFIPFEFARLYKSHSNKNGLFGWNWNHPLDTHLVIDSDDSVFRDQSGAEVCIKFAKGNGPGLVGSSDDNAFKIFREKDNLVLHNPDLVKFYFRLTDVDSRDAIKPIRIEDLNGNTISFEYDVNGFLRSIEDTLSRHIVISHNQRGKITELKLVLSSPKRHVQLVRYLYDKNDNLVTVQDCSANACHFEYRNHLMVRYTNKIGGSYYAQYDDQRRCINVWGDGGIKQRKIVYDNKKHKTSVTDALGHTIVYKYNDAGLVTDEINPLGGIQSTLYDANNDLLASLNEIGQTKTTSTYDPESRVLTVMDASGAATVFKHNDRGQTESKTDAVGATWTWSYDSFGNLTRAVSPSGAEWHFEYDTRGFLIKTMNPKGYIVQQSMSQDGKSITVRDELGVIIEYRYDDLGNLIAAIDSKGAYYGILRDALGRVCERKWPDDTSFIYEYDAEGNVTKLVDELLNETQLRYNQFGTCVKSVGPLGEGVRFEHDLEENLTAIVNENGYTHHFIYDALNRITKQIFFDGSEEQYKYDDLGNIVEITDGEGTITQVNYDEVRNIVEKIYPDGTSENLSYDGLRRLTGVNNDYIYVHLDWDIEGNLTREVQGERILKYTYDSIGNIVGLEDSGGRTIKYDYDSRRRLIRIDDNATGLHQFGYDASNLLTRHEFPNAAVLFNEYDQRGRFDHQRLTLKSDTLLHKSYQFDPADRLVESFDSHLAAKYFEYDPLERLTSISINEDPLERYSYDLASNIIYSSMLGVLSYEQGNLLKETPQGKYEYDRRGAVVRVHKAESKITYQYNGAGKLSRVFSMDGSVTEFTYDAFGRRMTKSCNGEITKYVWNGFTLLEEIRSESRTQYLFDPNRLTPLSQTYYQQIYHFVSDARGCVFATMDDRAKITGLFDYTAFGSLREHSENIGPPQPFRLRGQFYDEETGLHYNLHRYFEPTTGRFLTRDPLGIIAGTHLYAYAPNPITWEDPFGLSSECQGDVFYRAVSNAEKKKILEDCQLHAKQSKCPDAPFVTQSIAYSERCLWKNPKKYNELVEICTKPGTVNLLQTSPLARRCSSQAKQGHFPGLQDVVSGLVDKILHKLERSAINYGLGKGMGLQLFNGQITSMKVVGTNETCVPS